MKLLKIIGMGFILICQLLSNQPVYGQELDNTNNLTIVVSSCDKYTELWDGFFKLLFEKWPSLKTKQRHIPILLIANSKTYADPSVKTLHTSKEEGWTGNLLEALKQVKTEYVLYLQDDYFFERIDEKRFNQIFDYMKSHKEVSSIELFKGVYTLPTNEKVQGLPGALYKGQYEEFRVNLQAGLWRTEDLKWLLRPGENPWEFELQASIRSQGMRSRFINMRENPPFEYINMSQGGYLNAESLKKAEKLGVQLKNSTLPIDADHKLYLWYKKELQGFIYHQIIVPCKQFFHWIFNKL